CLLRGRVCRRMCLEVMLAGPDDPHGMGLSREVGGESLFDFGKLIDLAGMRDELNNKLAASAAAAAAAGGPSGGAFAGHWGTALLWKVESRYQPRTEAEARGLHEAITHDPDGVLPWSKNFW